MGRIPADAIHWDSGDWIEWHRAASNVDDRPCTAATADMQARLTALLVGLLRSANSYYETTGHHLAVYPVIAQLHAALTFDLPFEGPDRTCARTGVEILHIPPHGPGNRVRIDLSRPFTALIVVRIKDNFTCEARMIARNKLPQTSDDAYEISWQALPKSA